MTERQSLQTELTGLEARLRELNDALEAGQDAAELADKVIAKLDKAENWGLLSVITSLFVPEFRTVKQMKEINPLLDALQIYLRRYHRKLTVVAAEAPLYTEIRENLFSVRGTALFLHLDYAYLRNIQGMLAQVKTAREEINNAQSHLLTLRAEAEQRMERIRSRQEEGSIL